MSSPVAVLIKNGFALIVAQSVLFTVVAIIFISTSLSAGTGLLTQEEVDKRQVNYAAGQNAVLILDESLIDLTLVNPALTNMRQATADDLLVLTSSSFIGTTVGGNPQLINGVSVPLADNWVITPEEQAEIKKEVAVRRQLDDNQNQSSNQQNNQQI